MNRGEIRGRMFPLLLSEVCSRWPSRGPWAHSQGPDEETHQNQTTEAGVQKPTSPPNRGWAEQFYRNIGLLPPGPRPSLSFMSNASFFLAMLMCSNLLAFEDKPHVCLRVFWVCDDARERRSLWARYTSFFCLRTSKLVVIKVSEQLKEQEHGPLLFPEGNTSLFCEC